MAWLARRAKVSTRLLLQRYSTFTKKFNDHNSRIEEDIRNEHILRTHYGEKGTWSEKVSEKTNKQLVPHMVELKKLKTNRDWRGALALLDVTCFFCFLRSSFQVSFLQELLLSAFRN